jgi:hypothetical protein
VCPFPKEDFMGNPSQPSPLSGPPGNANMPAAPPPLPLGADPGMRWLMPVGRSWVAIVAGYLGLISVLLVPAPLALAFGIWGIVHIRKNPGKHGMGRAIFGIVMGAIFSVFLVIVAVAMWQARTHGSNY